MPTVLICKKCGSNPVATNSKGEKVCISCIGITGDGQDLEEKEVSPVGAKCTDCGFKATEEYLEKWNSGIPPFFNEKRMTFYCGCRGWN